MKQSPLCLMIVTLVTLLPLPSEAQQTVDIGYIPKELSVNVNGYRLNYYKLGKGPVLVLLHGFGGSKDSFLPWVGRLSARYTVYMPDLPGFGDTPHDVARNYSIRSQVRSLHDFLLVLEPPNEVYLVGNDMGGHIAAAYALAYPKDVLRLVLLSPAGLKVDDPVPYKKTMKPLENEQDFDDYMKLVFVKRPTVPAANVRAIVRKSQEHFAWENRIRDDIRNGQDYILNDRIANIEHPILIVWGDGDGIIHPVHAPLWHSRIKGSQLIVLQGCGHQPQMERPEETAQIILKFLAE